MICVKFYVFCYCFLCFCVNVIVSPTYETFLIYSICVKYSIIQLEMNNSSKVKLFKNYILEHTTPSVTIKYKTLETMPV